MAELGLRFLRAARVRGIGNIEFKRDRSDGKLKLIECNLRFTMANELLRLAGIDLALFAYNRLLGRPTPPVDSYREDMRMCLVNKPGADVRSVLCDQISSSAIESCLQQPESASSGASSEPKDGSDVKERAK